MRDIPALLKAEIELKIPRDLQIVRKAFLGEMWQILHWIDTIETNNIRLGELKVQSKANGSQKLKEKHVECDNET